MLQYKLTGVWFVLTVIHINVELISLKNKRGEHVKNFIGSFHYALFKPTLLIRTEDRDQGSEVTAILF